MQPFDRGGTGLDETAMILGEVADVVFVSPDHFAAINELAVVAAGFAQFGFRCGRRIRQQCIQESSLSRAVASHQRDLLATADAGAKVTNYELLVIRFAKVLDFENVLARGPR